jgi:ABC-type polysaccharide/polyol phosphate export permease
MRPTIPKYVPNSDEGIRVVHALMMRELKTRFGNNHLGFAWLFIEPLLFIVPVVLFWTLRAAPINHGLPFVEFIMTAYPPFVMWRNCVSRSRSAISGNSGLLYHRMITPARIVLARCLLEIASSFLAIGSMYIGLLYIGWVRPPAALPFFLFGWLYMAMISWASATLLSALGETSEAVAKMVHTFNYLMLAAGGAFYMVEWMPEWLQKYLVWIPTVQAFELLRSGYFGDSVKTHWDPINLLICFLVPAAFGLHILKAAREHMELE